MPHYKSLLASLLILLSLSACEQKQPPLSHFPMANCDYYSLKTAQCENEKQMIKSLDPYKVIFIGDHHREDDLHRNIAKLIEALSENGTKVILANEWFYPSDNKILNQYTSNEDNQSQFIQNIQWNKRIKWYNYDSFSPLYKAIKENGGKLKGINLSKGERKRISDQNLWAMSKEERTFNDTLDLQVSPHRGLVMPFLSNCHAPKVGESLKECSERMYRVQVAWDGKMALESYKLSKNLKENEKLIVFAGSMHFENRLGIPLRFARLSNLPTALIIPAEEKTKSVQNGLADFVLFYQGKEKE